MVKDVQWNLCNPTPEFSDILWHPTKIYGPKVVLLTKIKPEYSDILYNPTHFPGPLVCWIRQVPLYIYRCIICNQFNPQYFCACPKPGPGFRTSYVVVPPFLFSELRWEVIVDFFDIGGIVNITVLNFS